jgi:predicted amidohydrolase YtcJ
LRVAMAMSVPPGTRFTELAKYRALKERFSSPDLKAGAIKIMLDGVIESRTAAMLEPYEGSNESGTPAWSEPFYREMVEKADASGLQVYTHAIGDRAVRMALDAYEQALRVNGNKNARWRIEHIETISPADIPRFARIGVLASMQPIHADPGSSAVWSRQIGPARLPWSFAWKSLLDAGARLVFSSDWPACIDVNPIRGLHVAVNRQTPEGKPEGGWVPRQKVTLEQALRAYTAGGAYASFEESSKGMLKAGMLGDAVVFQQDLFAIPPSRIHEVKVAMTVVNGRVVYR